MKILQWKWIFTGSKTCCTIWRPFWFAIAAILNPKWSPRYKNPPIWAKFGFQVDYDVTNWYPLFGSHAMILQIISYLVLFVFDIYLLICFIIVFFSLFFFWKRGCFVSSFDIFFYNLFWLHLYLQLKGNGDLHVFLNSVMNPHIVDNNLVDLIGNVVRQITLDTIGLVCILNA
jgi:hypothetical protein